MQKQKPKNINFWECIITKGWLDQRNIAKVEHNFSCQLLDRTFWKAELWDPLCISKICMLIRTNTVGVLKDYQLSFFHKCKFRHINKEIRNSLLFLFYFLSCLGSLPLNSFKASLLVNLYIIHMLQNCAHIQHWQSQLVCHNLLPVVSLSSPDKQYHSPFSVGFHISNIAKVFGLERNKDCCWIYITQC